MALTRIRSLWFTLRDSLWFVPTLMVGFGVALALALIELESVLGIDFAARWPHFFGAGAEGTRGMLTAIATSMMTVAGVVFSITVVALSLAASQYSPRVLRNFMADRPTQVVLGAFVAIFAYCLIVLRTIRGGAEAEFVPALAVFGGVVGAFIGVGLLIYFIHHVASSIQVAPIISRIAGETESAIDRLFPADVGDALRPRSAQALPAGLPCEWVTLMAPRTGYVVGIDGERLLALAAECATVLRIAVHVGDFVVEGLPLLQVAGRSIPEAALADRMLACFTQQAERTVHQDVPYGLQQIVDVALKALSPGINDPMTAVACIDLLGALMVRVSERVIEGPGRSLDGTLRLIAPGPDYAALVSLAFDAIGDHADQHAEIYARLIVALGTLEQRTVDPWRRRALAQQVDTVLQQIAHAGLLALRVRALERSALPLRQRLLSDPPARAV